MIITDDIINKRLDRDELLSLRRRGGGGRNANNDMDNLASESQSLEQSNLMVHGLLENGQASLLGLQEQRKQLRSVRGVMNEIGNRLGLTQSTMRIIERRDITDAYLVAAGMVVTCLVIYFVWF
jgi:golgi SNAP receptor complex member 2